SSSTPPRSTANSTRTDSSAPDSATRAIGCSVPEDPLNYEGYRARSSGGQSSGLILQRSQVRALPGPLRRAPASDTLGRRALVLSEDPISLASPPSEVSVRATLRS